jgi:hypothetical protein
MFRRLALTLSVLTALAFVAAESVSGQTPPPWSDGSPAMTPQRLARMSGKWNMSARFGLGELTISAGGSSINGQAKHINYRFSATLDKNGKGATGRWSGTSDGKTFGGKVVVDIYDEGSIAMLLYNGNNETSTWAIWYAKKVK